MRTTLGKGDISTQFCKNMIRFLSIFLLTVVIAGAEPSDESR
jgi:hypothetical protein